MKSKAWLPLLSLTSMLPQTLFANTSFMKCSSEKPSIHLSFYKPYQSEFNDEYTLALIGDREDQASPIPFSELNARGEVSATRFKVILNYYYTPTRGPIINKDMGTLEGQQKADGKWQVRFTAFNSEMGVKEGTSVSLDCETK